VAILDIYPKLPGQVVVISKKHYVSYILGLPSEIQQSFLQAAGTVANLMVEKLGVERTTLIMEGLEINHAHIKLYPVYEISDYIQKIGQKAEKAEEKQLEEVYQKFI